MASFDNLKRYRKIYRKNMFQAFGDVRVHCPKNISGCNKCEYGEICSAENKVLDAMAYYWETVERFIKREEKENVVSNGKG